MVSLSSVLCLPDPKAFIKERLQQEGGPVANLQTDLELFYDKFDPGGIGSILPADFECGTRLIFCVARLMCECLPLICALLVVIEFHLCRDVTLVVNVASHSLLSKCLAPRCWYSCLLFWNGRVESDGVCVCQHWWRLEGSP